MLVRTAHRVRDLGNIEIAVGIHADAVRPQELPGPFALRGVPKLAHPLPLQGADRDAMAQAQGIFELP